VEALTHHLRAVAEEPGLLHRLRAQSLAGIGELTWDAAAGALLDAYADGIERIRATNPGGLDALVA
jgi:hypothetical protein